MSDVPFKERRHFATGNRLDSTSYLYCSFDVLRLTPSYLAFTLLQHRHGQLIFVFAESINMRILSIGQKAGALFNLPKKMRRIAYAAMMLFFLIDILADVSGGLAQEFASLCYSESGSNIRNVSNCALLAAALSDANPGDVIVLANGNYNCNQVSARNGTAARPIIIRASSARSAKFVNASVTVNGNYTVLANLAFDNSGVNVTGHYNRITSNKFHNNSGALGSAVTVNAGSNNRIDHNEVVDYGTGHRGFRIEPATTGNTTAKNNVMDRNYLHRSLGPRVNGADGIQLGTYHAHSFQQLNTIIEYNLIEEWDIDGEMISNKSSKNTIRFNTFANSLAHAPMRHGSFVDIISNFFYNVRGLVNYGDDNRIIGNTIQNGDLVIRDGDVTQSMMTSNGGHPASFRTLVAANTVINGQICVGCREPSGNNATGIPARYTHLKANNAFVRLLEQQYTTQSSSYSGTVIPAVKLFPQNVGPGSPDVCSAANAPLSPSLLSIQ
jgi:hypothetical protein